MISAGSTVNGQSPTLAVSTPRERPPVYEAYMRLATSGASTQVQPREISSGSAITGTSKWATRPFDLEILELNHMDNQVTKIILESGLADIPIGLWEGFPQLPYEEELRIRCHTSKYLRSYLMVEEVARSKMISPSLEAEARKQFEIRHAGDDRGFVKTAYVLLRLPEILGAVCLPSSNNECGRCARPRTFLRSCVLEMERRSRIGEFLRIRQGGILFV
jgi:hypothetical protein